ncbi:hypothetical protein evm_014931 [Chilo suppressalis]|nr:hypothetical protein evm_014931 [Chilo suppressalis]
MDPIAILQSRIEQLEAKLGLAADASVDNQQGDTVTANLLNTSQAISNATAGYEKLPEAMHRASELNNYTDPNLLENIQQNDLHMREVVAAEPIIKHHCHCMQRCKQAAPVLESEAIQQVPQIQESVNRMHAAAAEVKAEADMVNVS